MHEKIFEKLNPEDTKKPIMLIGMPGIAFVGKVAIELIIEQNKSKKILECFPEDLPPRVIINKEGVPSLHKISLHYLKIKNKEFLIVLGDIQPQSQKGQYEFADWVCQTAKKFDVQLILSCAASITPFFKENPGVHIAGNSFEIVQQFLIYKNVTPFKKGTITGSNGLIPALAGENYNIPAGCLLADTTRITEKIFEYDPIAAKAIIDILNKHLELEINTKKLDGKIKELTEALGNIKTTMDRATEKSDSDLEFIS
ncbi:MAG: PAC2 family protein [Candidatus Ranarchaeia archaeon]